MIPLLYLAAAVSCAAGISLWVWHDHHDKGIPANELLRVPGSDPVWIRCNDWEFRPALMSEVRPGDSFLYPEFYWRMRNLEASERYQRFMSALCEDEDTQEFPIPEDNWPSEYDLGGGD